MNLSNFELQLGQLALARGLIDLFGLLECATQAAEADRQLDEVFIDTELIAAADVEQLRLDLDEMSPQQLDRVVEQGDTMALKTLVSTEHQDRQTHRQELVDSMEVAETMVQPPPTPGEETGSAKSASYDGSTQPLGADLPEAVGEPQGDEQRYEILDELGRGGMGKIMRARDRVLDREIALKTVLPDTSDPQTRHQLLAEARLTGRLEHPSIVPVYELGKLSSDEPYYTMRVVPEHSLRATIEQSREDNDQAPSMLRLAQILRQVCLAMHFAHEKGVIHRDLKPENILLGEYGEVFVIDWGIATVSEDAEGLSEPTTETEPGMVMGTPHYMSPEQARGLDDIDRRSDIYAIGAILYELLTLTTAFSADSVMGLLLDVVRRPPEPPQERAPQRDIPKPLEEICLRAISKQRQDRYPTAQALAEELELYIEGVKDKERNRRRARELIEKAAEARRDYQQAQAELEEAIGRRNELRDAIPQWADPDERAPLWDQEERVEHLEVEVERKFGETTRLLGQSLGYMSLDEAHDELASLYWERFTEAEKRDDRQMAAHFENLVRQHDTGAFTDLLGGHADIRVEAKPPDTQLTLYRVEEQQRRLVATEAIQTIKSPLELWSIPHGRYRLVAEMEGYAPLQMPVVLDRLDSRDMQVRLWPREQIPEDFVVIPTGEFVTGDPEQFSTKDDTVYLEDYAIKRTPVTCREYLEFLNDLAEDDLDTARRHAPRTDEDAESYFPVVDGQFILPESDAEGDAWDPDWPISIVNYHDANAYAEWRSNREGRNYRLPTADEWEKAARGIDGRLYPWGSHFDPSFCRMRDSYVGKPMPAPVGAHRADVSPYGVLDMAGNVCEWTCTTAEGSPDAFRLRGGSHNSVALICQLHWYQDSPPSFRHAHYGFRLVLELSDTDGE